MLQQLTRKVPPLLEAANDNETFPTKGEIWVERNSTDGPGQKRLRAWAMLNRTFRVANVVSSKCFSKVSSKNLSQEHEVHRHLLALKQAHVFSLQAIFGQDIGDSMLGAEEFLSLAEYLTEKGESVEEVIGRLERGADE